MDSSGTTECDLSFKITTDEAGSREISSSPPNASISVDDSYIGTTPETADNLIDGYQKVVLRKTDYEDWGNRVSITAGDISAVDADLVLIPTTASTMVPASVPTTMLATIKTIRVSTITIPTSWPGTATSTQASLVDTFVIIVAVSLDLDFAAP